MTEDGRPIYRDKEDRLYVEQDQDIVEKKKEDIDMKSINDLLEGLESV